MVTTIRKTERDEYFITEYVTRDAFWDIYSNGCIEHYQLHNLRNHQNYIEALDFIAIESEIIVGNIVLSNACIKNKTEQNEGVLCLKSLAVLTDYQQQGIGAKLMKHAIAEAKRLGYKAIVIPGEESYFQQFGFKIACDFTLINQVNIQSSFMALNLISGTLEMMNGICFDFKPSEIDINEYQRFDKKFPYKTNELKSA